MATIRPGELSEEEKKRNLRRGIPQILAKAGSTIVKLRGNNQRIIATTNIEEIMVAIGVTGHRILTELDKINLGVDEALRGIEKAFPRQPR